MILFYRKSTGEVFSFVAGRVHGQEELDVKVTDSSIPEDDVAVYVIGWVRNGEENVEHHMENFKLMQRFENRTRFNPLDCLIHPESGIITERTDRQKRKGRKDEGRKGQRRLSHQDIRERLIERHNKKLEKKEK